MQRPWGENGHISVDCCGRRIDGWSAWNVNWQALPNAKNALSLFMTLIRDSRLARTCYQKILSQDGTTIWLDANDRHDVACWTAGNMLRLAVPLIVGMHRARGYCDRSDYD